MTSPIGVHILSTFPYCYPPLGGLQNAVYLSMESGYEGKLQVQPLRFLEHDYRTLFDFAIATEEAWSFKPWHEALASKDLVSKLAFDRKKFKMQFGISSSHTWDPYSPVEIHAGLSTNINEYLRRYDDYGQTYVIDTNHIQPLNWHKLIRFLPTEAIKLIHVHPLYKDMGAFFNSRGPAVEVLNALCDRGVDVPSIVEVFPDPWYYGWQAKIDWLSAIRQKARLHLL